MLGNARGGVKINICGGARSAPRFFILFWVEKLGLGGVLPPLESLGGGYYPFYPPTSYAPANILKKVTKLAPKNVLGKFCINNGQGFRPPPSTSSAVGEAPPLDAQEGVKLQGGGALPPVCPGGGGATPTPPLCQTLELGL